MQLQRGTVPALRARLMEEAPWLALRSEAMSWALQGAMSSSAEQEAFRAFDEVLRKLWKLLRFACVFHFHANQIM